MRIISSTLQCLELPPLLLHYALPTYPIDEKTYFSDCYLCQHSSYTISMLSSITLASCSSLGSQNFTSCPELTCETCPLKKKNMTQRNYTQTTAIEMNCTHCARSANTKGALERSLSINMYGSQRSTHNGIPWSVSLHMNIWIHGQYVKSKLSNFLKSNDFHNITLAYSVDF